MASPLHQCLCQEHTGQTFQHHSLFSPYTLLSLGTRQEQSQPIVDPKHWSMGQRNGGSSQLFLHFDVGMEEPQMQELTLPSE